MFRHFTPTTESTRDQERGELDSHEEVRLSFAGPGEIKRREVVLDPSSWPRRDQEQGGGAGLRMLDLFFCFSFSSTAVLQVPTALT